MDIKRYSTGTVLIFLWKSESYIFLGGKITDVEYPQSILIFKKWILYVSYPIGILGYGYSATLVHTSVEHVHTSVGHMHTSVEHIHTSVEYVLTSVEHEHRTVEQVHISSRAYAHLQYNMFNPKLSICTLHFRMFTFQ